MGRIILEPLAQNLAPCEFRVGSCRFRWYLADKLSVRARTGKALQKKNPAALSGERVQNESASEKPRKSMKLALAEVR